MIQSSLTRHEQVHGPGVRAFCDQTQGPLRKGDITVWWKKWEEEQE